MHALYSFLIDPKNNSTFDPSNPPSPEDFESWFESNYIQYNGDENNWFQGSMLIYSDGTIHQLCPKGDWRSRDTLFNEYKAMRKSIRWSAVLNLCARCLASDFGIDRHLDFSIPGFDGNTDKVVYPDVLSILEKFICKRLDDVKQWFTHKKDILDHDPSKGEFEQSDYIIQKFLRRTSYFISSYNSDKRFHIFSYIHSAYDDYRCMQVDDAGYILKEEDEPPLLCIAVVDIHT